MEKVGSHQPISAHVRLALRIGEAWDVVHSFKNAQFFVEDLCSAVEKNHRSFAVASGEDWLIIGIFPLPQEAADATNAWMKQPGRRRMNAAAA